MLPRTRDAAADMNNGVFGCTSRVIRVLGCVAGLPGVPVLVVVSARVGAAVGARGNLTKGESFQGAGAPEFEKWR